MSTCFIFLPMTTPAGGSHTYPRDHFQKVLNELCVPAVKQIGFKPIPPDEPGTHKIDEKILAQLREADLVLCDISSLNANVLYELGIRSALNKPFAIIKDELTKNPFDLMTFRHCPYDHKILYKSKKAKEDLTRKVAEHLRKTFTMHKSSAKEPVEGAAACGITKIFPSREEAKVEVLSAVKKAGQRLWILGVGLSQGFSLSDNLNTIEEKVELARQRSKRFDAKVLLLDALTSTGVFRTLLESNASKVGEIVNAARNYGDEYSDDPYFNEQLYRDFENDWTRFKGRSKVDNIVRFYGHSPSCWLVIADDTAYFQPYTFGSAPDLPKKVGNPIGPLMPVFRFDGAANVRPFKILEDHFRKLWLTTNTDLFHVRARNAEAQDTLYEIFRTREYWLRQVYGALHKPGRERRQYPRKRCKSKLDNYVHRDTTQAAAKSPVKAEKVIDFSREGLALKLRNIKLKKGDHVKVEVMTPRRPKGARKKEKAGEYVKRMLVDPYDGKFRVVHAHEEGEYLIVGLQPVKKKPARRNVSRR
jgi:hypothetical protein